MSEEVENRFQIPAVLRAAGWMIVLAFIAVLLRGGRSLFIPLVIAGIGVYFILMLERLILLIRIGRWRLPSFVALLVAFAIVFGAGSIIVSIVTNNARQLQTAAPQYQERFMQLQSDWSTRIDGWLAYVGIERKSTHNEPPAVVPPPAGAIEQPSVTDDMGEPLTASVLAMVEQPYTLDQLVREINNIIKLDFTAITTTVVKNLYGLIQTTTLILLLGIFIFIEVYFFPKKIQALFPDAGRRAQVEKILNRIDGDVQTYFGIKTLISLVTAFACYIVMRVAGLDFAEFWALIIFILNFIPAIGSIIATVLPSLFALLQFDTFGPVIAVVLGVTAFQVFFGNFLEPNLMGVTLNLSPLVVVLSLIVWGLIWGVVGMFLCVPITVIIVIILANFSETRWIAVLLSRKGDLRL